jgi:predicted nucleic acid-binding protein
VAQSSSLFAVDTNFLLDLAAGGDAALDALATIRRRVRNPVFLVPPTVIDELAWAAQNRTGKPRDMAVTALQKLKREWGFSPVDLIPVGHGIVEVAAELLITAGLLPAEERNDSLILAEAALLNCTVLLSSDRHLTGIDSKALTAVLKSKDLEPILVKAPAELVRQFDTRIRKT